MLKHQLGKLVLLLSILDWESKLFFVKHLSLAIFQLIILFSMKKYIPSLFLLFFFTTTINAQFPADILYQSIHAVTPPLPNYLNSVEDNSVPDAITITRTSEYNSDWNWYPIHEYAKAQPWNSDVSVYKLYSVAIYDAETHEMIRELPGGQIYPSYWSNTDSDKMYSFRESGEIRTYSVINDIVQTINTDIQGYDVVKLGPGEGNIDKNDKYIALVGKRGIDMDVIVFDLETNEIVHTEIFAGAWGNNASTPEYVDWVSVSQSGDFVGVMWNHNTTSEANPFNSHYGVELYNTTNMEFLRRIAKYGNHGDFGYAIDGDEVFVQFWGPTGTVNMYYLNRMERIVLTSSPDFSGEGHVSCRNLNRPGWAYVSQDEVVHTGQIVAMKLDDSGLVEHFGHHYSSSSTYNKSPMPVPTPNGEKIMFKSDFGNAANTDEVFIFEATKSTNLSNIDFSEEQIVLFPNPTGKLIHIKGAINISKLSLFNSSGKLIKSFSDVIKEVKQIDISNLENGVYFLKIGTIDKELTRKLIISN